MIENKILQLNSKNKMQVHTRELQENERINMKKKCIILFIICAPENGNELYALVVDRRK